MFPAASAAIPSGFPGWPSGKVAKRLTPRSAVAGESTRNAASARTATSAMRLRMSLPLGFVEPVVYARITWASICASALATQVIEDLRHDATVNFVVAGDLLHDRRLSEGTSPGA